jgi:pimeloyl-ACP methyl ester carboxylesterase
VSAPDERALAVNGHECRIWVKGSGERLGYLAGLGGLPEWSPFLERLAERRRVVVPSLPGFFGATGHEQLDGIEEWVAMALDLLEGAGLEDADLIGASIGGMIAAEVAAFSRASVNRLVLIAPFGLYADAEPVADVFARPPAELTAAWTSSAQALVERFSPPQDEEGAQEFLLELYRANVAAARLIWPFGDRGLRRRLHRITASTLLVWGSADRLIPASYAKRFADGIAGETSIRSIEGAGHLVDLDAPDAVAEAVLEFLGA